MWLIVRDNHQAFTDFVKKKKPQRSTHIQEALAITLKADEKVHLIDIVNALVILENTSDNLPSVICRQKQGFTITLGETPGLN